MSDGAFTVLCICTGNICRSPATERLLRRRFGAAVDVSSAGIRGLVGQPMSAPMHHLLTSDGVDADNFAARCLTPSMVRDAGLILGLTRDHRGDAVELHPGGVRRAFTLLEFARLLENIDPTEMRGLDLPGRLERAVALAAQQRAPRREPSEDDVADPYLRRDEVYEASYAAITGAVEQISKVVCSESGF